MLLDRILVTKKTTRTPRVHLVYDAHKTKNKLKLPNKKIN